LCRRVLFALNIKRVHTWLDPVWHSVVGYLASSLQGRTHWSGLKWIYASPMRPDLPPVSPFGPLVTPLRKTSWTSNRVVLSSCILDVKDLLFCFKSNRKVRASHVKDLLVCCHSNRTVRASLYSVGWISWLVLLSLGVVWISRACLAFRRFIKEDERDVKVLQPFLPSHLILFSVLTSLPSSIPFFLHLI
jgi:hypothetical protein